MSGASSNAAARRRRAAPPVNVQRLRQQQQQQQQKLTQQNSNNSTFNSNNISLNGLPQDENGRMMHPINILKNLNDRINVLENNPGSGTFSLENNEDFSNLTNNVNQKINQEIKNMNNTIMNSLQTCITNYSSLQDNTENKISMFEKQINSMQEKIEEIKELCSKIQTFSMETNMSFLIFKNQYDKNQNVENNTENASFINFIQNLNSNSVEDTESLQLEINTDCNSSEIENIIVDNIENIPENNDEEEEQENEEQENEEQEQVNLNIENINE